MNVQSLGVTKEQALAALREYKQYRNVYDKRDWEIERIYRAISKGKTIISVQQAIVNAGIDPQGRPKLAICEAHARACSCEYHYDGQVTFGIAPETGLYSKQGRIRVPWRDLKYFKRCQAVLPRIPPQYRPAGDTLSSYHVLWEADWTDIPEDPYLLKRIGKDSWVVLATWELTEVEMHVLRAHRPVN